MMKRAWYALVVVIFALSFAGCDQFFSTSWGKPRDYDPSKMNVNASNIDNWLKAAVGNPDLAKVLMDKILKELPNASKSDQAKLMAAGISLAVESSGLGQSILSNAAGALGNLGDGADLNIIKDIFGSIQGDFLSNGGVDAANSLANIIQAGLLPGTSAAGQAPTFSDDYINSVQPADVAEAVMVLALGVLGDTSFDSLTADDAWKDVAKLTGGLEYQDGKILLTANAQPSDVALAAYLNLIASNPGKKFTDYPLTSSINDAFLSSNT